MSNYGIKVSKQGKEVLEASDDEQIFTSKGFGLKIYKEGVVSVTVPGGSSDFSEHYTDVSHDLGYAPSYYGYIEDKDGNFIGLNVPFIEEMRESTSYLSAKAESTSTRLRLILTVVDCLGTDVTRDFKYFIFIDPVE